MKPALKIFTAIVVTSVTFVSGVIVGNTHQVTDFLCPTTPSTYLLSEDLVTDGGIVFPKGTVVPLRQCAYMQRFNWSFAIDDSIQLNKVKTSNDHDYGFSELQPK